MTKYITTLLSIIITIIFLSFELVQITLAVGPHGNYTALSGDCAGCHRLHTAASSRLLISADQGNAFCNSCHNGTDAPAVSTHTNQNFSGRAEAPFALTCVQCHDPHGSSNLYNIRESVVVSPTIGATTGPVVFTARSGNDSFDEADTASGTPESPAQTADDICATCHNNANNPGYPMSRHFGGDGHNGTDYRGQDCITCHAHANGFVHGGGFGTGCIECHGHDAGTNYDPDAAAPYTPGASASQGRGTFKSHSTHTETDADDARGPGIYCDACHDTNAFPYFRSGTDGNGDGRYDLAETDVCDACHSPGGTYDGVGDPRIGAKNNWDSGVYAGNNLISGAEKWCAGCHDENPSLIQNISAPNVIGDEDASTNYGLGYGFYRTGHGLPMNQTYPASGGTIPGADLSCGYCHDFSMSHIDGVARTYNYTAVEGAPDDYQNGYRLKSIDGQLPLVLPRRGTCADTGVNVTEFRLCLSCHDSEPFTDPNNYATNFRRSGTPDFNAHNSHLSIMFECDYGPVFQSDWRTHANDSRASCVTCHNVHGSEQLSMVRDGRLVNREPGLQVLYYRPGVSYSCFNYPDPRDVSLPQSTGTIWNPNVGGLCSACHGSCGLDSLYLRTPFDDSSPRITLAQGQVGSSTLTVDFSEGVYSDLGAAGDLIASDFVLTDLDNGRTIITVTHTAGQNTATLTLNAPLDAADDIGTDILAAAPSTIYDALGNPMDTTPVTITGPGAGAQTLRLYPSGLNSAANCNPVGGIWADILDSNDGATTYADCYSYFEAPSSELFPAQFEVNMDDPSGLAGATINELTARAVVDVTQVTGGGGPPGSIAYLQICYDTGGPTQACSALYDLDASEGYVEIWAGDTVDPDGNPLDLNDLNNLNVEVTLSADDCCGDADATAYVTQVYAEVDYTVETDFDPPAISNQTPANGTGGVNVGSNLTFSLSDSSSGVNWTTFAIQLSGSNGYSELYTGADFFVVSKTGSPASYEVTVNSDVDFGGEEVITVTVQVDDYAGNSLAHPAWSFTTAPAVVLQTLILRPSGVVTDGGFIVSGGTWADALDTNDGDTSHVHFCCSSPGQVFYVDMDDPALSGVTIQNLTVYVYARYVDGNSPAPPIITGTLDIGYRTGTDTIWRGSATTDASGSYNLISSATYSLDSDSGPLDLADITNLQIAVQRNSSGGAKLRVTEIYVEVAYQLSGSDTNPPALSAQNPANGAGGVAVASDLTFTLADGGSGVDWGTFSIQLSGDAGYSALYTASDSGVVSNTGSAASYDVTVNPDTNFGEGEVITVVVNVDDLAGNSLLPPTWSFTTATAATPQTITLYPSGLATATGSWSTSGGDWADVLDSNDADSSYAVLCCTSPGWTFYVDLDDPGGLDTATIQSLTFYAYARYRSSPGGSDIPFAGLVNIGYRTGTNTEWRGDYTTDTSGDYNLISSGTYTTDSDGGPLDLADINNLQLAVQRNSSGSPQIRVTAVYAEVVYVPGSQRELAPPAANLQETVYLPIIIKD